MSDNAWKEADQLVANCTHGLEFAETAEHYADLRTRIRSCIAYQIIERDRARQDPYSVAGVKGYVPEDHPWANLKGHFQIDYLADAGEPDAGIRPWSCFVVSFVGEYEAEFNRLRDLAYETPPGAFSPDGWTWKQAFQAEKKRREEAEAAIETLHEQYAQERISRARQTLSDNTKMENQ